METEFPHIVIVSGVVGSKDTHWKENLGSQGTWVEGTSNSTLLHGVNAMNSLSLSVHQAIGKDRGNAFH